MKLKRIKIAGFRGFNDEQEIEFDSDLVIISGDGHTGKTSLAEALEWLLFGYTARCRRGKDKYSKIEYRGSYRNVHYPDDEIAFVELKALQGDEIITLRRELIGEEESEAYLDGQSVDDFTSLGFSPTASHPVIAQHGLRDFIHTNPKSRREILSYVLGLESLIKLQGDIRDAHTEYTQRKPKAYDTYDRLSEEAEQSGMLGSVLSHLEAGSLQEAREGLLEEICERIGVSELPESVIPERLSETKAKKKANVLSISAYQVSDDLEGKSKMVREQIERLSRNFPSVVDKLTEFIKAASLPSETKRFRFIKLGLDLISDLHPEICPFCKQETLTEKQRESYAELVEEFEDPKRISKQIDKELEGLASEWQGIFGEASRFAPKLPEGEGLDKIRQLLAGKAELTEYETARIKLVRQGERWNTLNEEGEEQMERARQMLKERQYDETFFDQLLELPRRLKELASSLLKHQIAYKEQFYRIKPILEDKISSAEEVKAITLLQDFWNRWSEIVKAVRYDQLESKFGELEKKARSFIAQKQEERLEQKEKEIQEWYEVLNPNEDVTFKRIRVTKTALRLLGESYGKEIEAAPNFSLSQLNCLGLAVYLTKATSVGDLGFVVLDDPVQSLDEPHSERLKMDVISRLLDKRHQVILHSHLDNFADGVFTAYKHQIPYWMEFGAYSQSGPHIEDKKPRLKQFIQGAKENQKGNTERRRLSACYLRLAMERIIKELYTHATGEPIPKKYRDAFFKKLCELLPDCNISPKEEDGIKDTYKFVVSHPHDDMTIEAATTEQLQPHIKRLEQLCNKYNLLYGKS